jgi:hypothetical protein
MKLPGERLEMLQAGIDCGVSQNTKKLSGLAFRVKRWVVSLMGHIGLVYVLMFTTQNGGCRW